MTEYNLPIDKVKEKISNAKSISILSHVNPDADTLGTALGIYALLKESTNVQVEVVNSSKGLPLYLDFLPYYTKIKQNIEYEDSLVITCDCGNIQRLGLDISTHEIINIDHHQSNTNYGDINVVIPQAVSASQVGFELFESMYIISHDTALCFYTALVSDTQFFTTQRVCAKTFALAQSLIAYGVDPAKVAYHFKQRKPLSAVRVLGKALETLTLHESATIATICISKDAILATGAMMPDLEGIVEYAKSLVCVEVAICVIELDNAIRVSLRSKVVDVSKVAVAFGGGGHKLSAGFTLEAYSLQESIDIILQKIKILDLISTKSFKNLG